MSSWGFCFSFLFCNFFFFGPPNVHILQYIIINAFTSICKYFCCGKHKKPINLLLLRLYSALLCYVRSMNLIQYQFYIRIFFHTFNHYQLCIWNRMCKCIIHNLRVLLVFVLLPDIAIGFVVMTRKCVVYVETCVCVCFFVRILFAIEQQKTPVSSEILSRFKCANIQNPLLIKKKAAAAATIFAKSSVL